MVDDENKIVIIGAGPAGLTLALELLKRTSYKPLVFESLDQVGGISKTVVYKGNRMDLGGHRFFSKSGRILDWWESVLPIQNSDDGKRFLLKDRLSRIYYNAKFFDYPITLTFDLFKKLGLLKIIKIGIGYIYARIFPRQPEISLEDFFVNRFGRELYQTFFKNYTAKVWGKDPRDLDSDWGAQRVKSLDVTKVILNALKKPFRHGLDYKQGEVETSLIERFLYPELGPGQFWEEVADQVIKLGGEIVFKSRVVKLYWEKDQVTCVDVLHVDSGEIAHINVDLCFTTMPIKELFLSMSPSPPTSVFNVATNLEYRNFITVGLLLDSVVCKSIKDNWIYVHEPGVSVGRVQFFNNWSEKLVSDSRLSWVGMEYFCDEDDDVWKLKDDILVNRAFDELVKIGLAKPNDFVDGTVVRVPKAYPTYSGAYKELDVVRRFTDGITNLYLLGRNGQHRYNNQDHSMLTALTAVDNLVKGKSSKKNIWETNTEPEYHETKK